MSSFSTSNKYILVKKEPNGKVTSESYQPKDTRDEIKTTMILNPKDKEKKLKIYEKYVLYLENKQNDFKTPTLGTDLLKFIIDTEFYDEFRDLLHSITLKAEKMITILKPDYIGLPWIKEIIVAKLLNVIWFLYFLRTKDYYYNNKHAVRDLIHFQDYFTLKNGDYHFIPTVSYLDLTIKEQEVFLCYEIAILSSDFFDLHIYKNPEPHGDVDLTIKLYPPIDSRPYIYDIIQNGSKVYTIKKPIPMPKPDPFDNMENIDAIKAKNVDNIEKVKTIITYLIFEENKRTKFKDDGDEDLHDMSMSLYRWLEKDQRDFTEEGVFVPPEKLFNPIYIFQLYFVAINTIDSPKLVNLKTEFFKIREDHSRRNEADVLEGQINTLKRKEENDKRPMLIKLLHEGYILGKCFTLNIGEKKYCTLVDFSDISINNKNYPHSLIEDKYAQKFESLTNDQLEMFLGTYLIINSTTNLYGFNTLFAKFNKPRSKGFFS